MKIALVGNQNSGKTTLFNVLTGMNAKIGNWPGVTIEKKSGIIKGTNHEITDLPGIYSLSPYSVEEEVSRKFIFEENPDVIINIVDSTSLERSLYLTTQLLELDCNVIIALNMADILEKKGIRIDINLLEKLLGAKVIKISALKEFGIQDLINEVEKNEIFHKPYIYDSNLENAIAQTENNLPQVLKHKRFISVKILEDDNRFSNLENNKINNIKVQTSKNYDTDLEETIATERYSYIEKVKKQVLIKFQTKDSTKGSISDRLDKIFLNKFLAFPIFIIIMFLIYYISVGLVGGITTDFVSNLVESFSQSTLNVLR